MLYSQGLLPVLNTLSVKDANGCTFDPTSVTITAPDAISGSGAVTSNYNGSQVSCNGSTDGEITITAGGGTTPLSYTLSGGTLISPVTQSDNGVFSGLGAGTYNYSVTDANNCTASTGTVTITQPDAISASAAVTSNYNGSQVSCNGSTDGEITITAGGGTTPLSYTLSGGTLISPVTQSDNGVFSGLGAGTYNYSVTDANNCTASTGTVTITQPDAISASAQ